MQIRAKAFSDAREKLVKELEKQGIYDNKVLEAFSNIPRHIFVPDVLVFDAYKNTALPMGFGQTVSQPITVAFMTQELNISKDDIVLEIGTGSGFQTAILSYLSKKVYTVEVIKNFTETAKKKHKKLGLTNIYYKIGNGNSGWEEFSPYSKIIVTAALNSHPETLFKQLAEDGEMIYPFYEVEKQKLYKITKKAGKIYYKTISDCNFVIAV